MPATPQRPDATPHRPDTAPQGRGATARVPSPVLVIGGIASVQFGNAIADGLFTSVGAGGAGLLRLTMAALVALALWRPRLRSLTRATLLPAVAFGLTLAAMNLTFYHAIARIPMGIAVTIEFVGPLVVAIAGSRRPRDLLWVLLAAGGIVALAHGATHHLDLLGVLLSAGAGAFWGIYILVQARLGQAFTDASGLALGMAVAALLALPDGVIEGGGHLLRVHSLVLGLVVGILSSVLPYSFELEALRRISTGTFGVLMSLEPGVGAIAGLLVLSQGLSARGVAGIVLVSLASLGVSLEGRRRIDAYPA